MGYEGQVGPLAAGKQRRQDPECESSPPTPYLELCTSLDDILVARFGDEDTAPEVSHGYTGFNAEGFGFT